MERLNLHIHLNDSKIPVATIDGACAVPSRGDRVWVKTNNYQGGVIVNNVEHVLDQSLTRKSKDHNIILWCTDET